MVSKLVMWLEFPSVAYHNSEEDWNNSWTPGEEVGKKLNILKSDFTKTQIIWGLNSGFTKSKQLNFCVTTELFHDGNLVLHAPYNMC